MVRHPRLPGPRARRRRPRPAGVDGPRDVRRPHPRAGGRPRPPAPRPRAGRPRARLPRRLGFGLGGGRDEDGAPVAPRGRPPADPLLHDPRRLPRRHLLAHVGDRPGRRHALPLPRGPARAPLRPAPTRGAGPRRGRPGPAPLGAGDAGPVLPPRRRHRRRHRRAGAPGRRGDARVASPARSPSSTSSPASTAHSSSTTRSPPVSTEPDRGGPARGSPTRPTSSASASR